MTTIVYGITASTEMFINSEYNTGNNIFACTNGGESFKGTPAKSLEELSKLEKKHTLQVVICSEFVFDILQSLNTIGITTSQCSFFNHMSGKLTPCIQMQFNIDIESTLYAFYDLSYNLPCFDVTTFVVLAEIERKKQNKKNIQFVIVPSNFEDKPGLNIYHDNADTKWRIEKLIKPIFNCLASCIGIDQPISQSSLVYYKSLNPSIYPNNYFENPRQAAGDFKLLKSYADQNIKLSNLAPPQQAYTIVNDFIRHNVGKKKLITITLREYWANSEHRNSNKTAWLDFALSLDMNEYFPLIIRDTYKVSEPLEEKYQSLTMYPIAAVDLSIRLALYHQAYINMGVDNGPLYPISYLEGARSIIFRWCSNEIPNLSDRTNSMHFFKVGENHFFNDNGFQINAWMDDSFENIQTQFSVLENKINKAAI